MNADPQTIEAKRFNRYSLAETPVMVADKTVLSTLVVSCAYKQAHYTAESYVAYMSALTSAQGVLNNDTATQEEVDEAVVSLQAAIGGLVEVSKPADNTSNDNSNDGSEVNSGETSGTNTGSDNNQNSSASSGCSGTLGAVSVALTLLGAATVVALKKKED